MSVSGANITTKIKEEAVDSDAEATFGDTLSIDQNIELEADARCSASTSGRLKFEEEGDDDGDDFESPATNLLMPEFVKLERSQDDDRPHENADHQQDYLEPAVQCFVETNIKLEPTDVEDGVTEIIPDIRRSASDSSTRDADEEASFWIKAAPDFETDPLDTVPSDAEQTSSPFDQNEDVPPQESPRDGADPVVPVRLHHATVQPQLSDRPKYFCELCNKSFTRSSTLHRHRMVHAGTKPYSCSVCNKPFSQLGHLSLHMRTHTGEKPYECGACGKTFRLLSSQQQHMRTHTGETPYECAICGRRFAYSFSLLSHTRMHQGEKPYCCSTCGKRFTVSSNLRQHMRIHTGEKPHACGVCDRRFSQSSHLRGHMKTHAPGGTRYCGVAST